MGRGAMRIGHAPKFLRARLQSSEHGTHPHAPRASDAARRAGCWELGHAPATRLLGRGASRSGIRVRDRLWWVQPRRECLDHWIVTGECHARASELRNEGEVVARSHIGGPQHSERRAALDRYGRSISQETGEELCSHRHARFLNRAGVRRSAVRRGRRRALGATRRAWCRQDWYGPPLTREFTAAVLAGWGRCEAQALCGSAKPMNHDHR